MSTLELVFGGQSPQFLDDDNRPDAQNGKPALARIVSAEISLLNQLAHCGHPIYSWATGDLADAINTTALETTSCWRQVYMAANKGAASEGGEFLTVEHANESSPGFQTGQGIDVSIGSSTFHAYWNFSTAAAFDFPGKARLLPFDGSFGYSTVPAEVIIGGVTQNWPLTEAGTIWQNPENSVDSSKTSTVGSADVISKKEIVGVRATGREQLTALTSVFRETWFHQRPQGGWSSVLPGQTDSSTAAIRGIHMTTAANQMRYVFDQTYGIGGTSMTSTSPAITLPLHHAGGGISTQVRVYVFMYAAMSGGVNDGSIGVANKDASGSMPTGPTTLANSPTITGTTFQWYPTLATWNATTAPYFLGYTGSAFDRVALCTQSTGTTNHVIVGAFTFVVSPATS